MKAAIRTNIFLIIFLAAAFYLHGCGGDNGSENTTGPENGTPTEESENEVIAEYIDSAKIIVNEIWLRDSDGVEQQLLLAPREIELVPTSGDTATIHVELNIPTGKYDRARLVVESGVVTLSNDVFVENGNIFSTELGNLKLPSAMQNGIKVNLDSIIELDARDVQELIFSVDFAKSFVFNGPANHTPGVKEVLFKPVIHIIKNVISGHLSLTVNRPAGIKCSDMPEPLAGALVTAIDANTSRIIEQNLVTTTNELGQASLQLLPGFYDIVIESEGYNPLTIPSVEVSIARSINLGEVAMARPVNSTAFDQDTAILMAIMMNMAYADGRNGFTHIDKTKDSLKDLNEGDVLFHSSDYYDDVYPAPISMPDLFDAYLGSGKTPGQEVYIETCWKFFKFIEQAYTGGYKTQLFVAYHEKTGDIVVSFRGTSEIEDIVTDVEANKADWSQRTGEEPYWHPHLGETIPSAVHMGIRNAYWIIGEQLQATLNEAIARKVTNPANSRVYFTGHSLGGGLATLAALDFADYLIKARGYQRENIVMYSYGAPRTITENLKNIFHNTVPNGYAIAAKDDYVPHLPARGAGVATVEYTHIRKLIALSTNIKKYNAAAAEKYNEIGNTRYERSYGLPFNGCAILVNPEFSMPGGSKYGKKGHDQVTYIRRVANIVSDGTPSISVDSVDTTPLLPGGERLRLSWKGGIKGPCDWVALYRTDKGVKPKLNDTEAANDYYGLRKSWEWVINGNRKVTGTNPNGPIDATKDFWIGYVDGFGRIVKISKYRK